MTFNPQIHYRRSIRLKGYDYGQRGMYFVTLCAYNKQCIFGQIVDNKMILNEFGKIAYEEWLKTSISRPAIELHEFIIMPNHLHGIIVIANQNWNFTTCTGPWQQCTQTMEQFGKPTSNTIPTIIRGYKATVTKQINVLRSRPTYPVWQRNYYEHIIRNEESYQTIREYVWNNPFKWYEDTLYAT